MRKGDENAGPITSKPTGGRSRRLRSTFLVCATLGLLISSPARGATVQSTLKSGGYYWFTSFNWTNTPAIGPGDFPNNGIAGNTYEVTLPFAVSLTSDYTIDRLTTSNTSNSLIGNGAATSSLTVLKSVSGPLPLYYMTMTVPAGASVSTSSIYLAHSNLQLGGVATLSGSSFDGISGTLDVRSTGALTVTGEIKPTPGSMNINNSGVLKFENGITLPRDVSLHNLNGGTFTLTPSALADSTIQSSFTNDGTFRLTNRVLTLNLPPEGPLHRLGGTVDLQTGSTLKAYATQFSGATLTGSGKLLIGRSSEFLTTTDLPATLSTVFGSNTGIVTVAAPVRARGPAIFGDSTFKGTGGVTFDNLIFGSSDPLAGRATISTPVVIPQSGSITLQGTGEFVLDAGSLEIFGAWNDIDTQTTRNQFNVSSTGTGAALFTVRPTASMTLKRTLNFSAGNSLGLNFLNQGAITINAGALDFHSARATNEGTIKLFQSRISGFSFNNTGLVEIGDYSSVTLTQNAADVTGGQYTVASYMSQLSLTGGQFAATSVTNLGSITLDSITLGGSMNIGGQVRLTQSITLATPLTLSGRPLLDVVTLKGPGTLTLASDYLATNGTLITQTGITVAAGSTLSTAFSLRTELGGKLNVEGTVKSLNVSTVLGANSQVNVKPGGVINISGTATGSLSANKGVGTLDNAGLVKAADGGVLQITSPWTVKNSGTIQVQSASLGIAGSNWTNTGRMEIGSAGWLALGGTSTGSSLAQIQAQLAAGQSGGAGIGTLTGSPANAGIAYGTAGALLGITGTQIVTWHSLAVDPNAILMQYTISGDADIDGTVNLNDLIRLANHYGQTSGATWADGDFDYDGAVNLNDLIRLANQYGSQLGAEPVAMDFVADLQATMGGTVAPASVPEPAALGSIAAATLLLLNRRRARRNC